MIAAWLLVTLPLGGLVALAAWCAAGTAALRGRATRWAYAAGLVALVVLVVATPFRTVPAAPDDARPVTRPTPITTTAPTPPPPPPLAERLAALREAALAGVARAAALPRPVHVALGAAWLLASLGTATVLVVAWRRIRRATDTWPAADLDGTRVRIAPSGAPMVVGLAAPVIVVPARVVALPPTERAMVLAHERAHVEARDPWLLMLGAAVTVLVPWHPAAWWLASRLALAIETDCDARVLAAGASVRAYGALLVAVASSRATASFLHPWPALVAGRSSLETRLMTMTARSPRFAGLRAGALAIASIARAVTACSESTLPTAADVATTDAASAVRAATVLTNGGPATYVVDGRTVRYEEATAIRPDSIVSIEVVRKNAAGDSSPTIRIATRRADAGRTLVALIKPEATGTLVMRADSLVIRDGERLPLTATGTPIYLLDGRRIDAAAMKAITPDRIASVEVIKGDAAVARFGPDAKHGAVMIFTKPAR